MVERYEFVILAKATDEIVVRTIETIAVRKIKEWAEARVVFSL